MSTFVEWCGTTFFSFLESTCSPETLIEESASRGYAGMAVADRLSVSGLVGALVGTERVREKTNPQFFHTPGIRLHFDHADPLLVYPLHRGAYADLCEFLSTWSLEGHCQKEREKGLTPIPWNLFLNWFQHRSPDYIVIALSGRFFPFPQDTQNSRIKTQELKRPEPSFSVPPQIPGQTPFSLLELVDICGKGETSSLSLAYPLTLSPGIEDLWAWLEEHSQTLNIPLLATYLPLMISKQDLEVTDLVTAIRHRVKLSNLGYLRQPNADRRLHSPRERKRMRQLIETRLKSKLESGLLNNPFERGIALTQRPHFCLRELKYTYPREKIPPSQTPTTYLRHLVIEGLKKRFSEEIPQDTLRQVEHELALIQRLQYEDYFLTIFDVLEYARSQNILFQGRGSAANSVVCYGLGITAIDPVRMGLLFERFISLERKEPPDIDVDFEHERREEVIQEVYSRYGRERAAMVSNYIRFRDRMAVRETGKALGFSEEELNQLRVQMGREGLVRLDSQKQKLIHLSKQVLGFPRHLSIHTGGFVLSHEKLSQQTILEPARMPGRTVVPWDKEDVEELGWMKVDLLSLGILTAIRKTLQIINPDLKSPIEALRKIPAECPQVYKSLQRADTVGVFQIESRAQMNMLPRLAPKKFYDLVVEIAIVRPGPLQGGMVHPYLRRKQGLDPVTYDHPSLKPILEKTLGVPIFQEQVMKIAVEVAGFTPGEADLLRKVMSSAWRSKSRMFEIRDRLFQGMAAKNISPLLAERLYQQIEGFGEYGFPESHSASFAILCYASSWLKVHHPAAFLCGLLNSQPMGFYSARALIADAERHNVEVLPVDITKSNWEAKLEHNSVRLGFQSLLGLSHKEAIQILNARSSSQSPYDSSSH
jgi:error-prone DNA polymerase